jgi:AAA15 family ATPase/GTPase
MTETRKLVEDIHIKNFKSIDDLKLSLGTINVFIGENGAGKSNVLEAIAFAAAASVGKTDNEFLAARGIRVTRPDLMRSAFDEENTHKDLKFEVELNTGLESSSSIEYQITNANEPYSSWQVVESESQNIHGKDIVENLRSLLDRLKNMIGDMPESEPQSKEKLENYSSILGELETWAKEEKISSSNRRAQIKFDVDHERPKMLWGPTEKAKEELGRFLIYSAENTALRTLEAEGQILPLGANGEGLLEFLSVLSEQKDGAEIAQIKSALSLFSWFSDMEIDSRKTKKSFRLKDRFISSKVDWMDQRSANEGFLFSAFYFSLFSSRLTPRFFAVDNIDASLNPKLCQELMIRLTRLAKSNGKQAILTTHNPAILDGLDLTDPEQRLFIVSRGRGGKTRVRQFDKPDATKRTRLSELFINGLVGGLPKGF